MESKHRTEYFNKKYRIGFYTKSIQQAFYNLLDHPCPKCDHPVFYKFAALREHVRKCHDHYYCDLCTDNLKIFSFERRCYSKSELMLHQRKGDPDNKSHRGHPLCEYCDKRYLDRDELFRHLRRDHYFCHFCDADGCNEFYKDYRSLREHFRKDHYLCEEGRCAEEEFTGAFRTEIDYKAHVANVHGKSLNKQQAKQARTLQLEITLGPRGRSGQNEPANLRSRGANEIDAETHSEPTQLPSSHRALPIDAHNEQEFPSLGNATPSLNLIPISMGLRARLGASSLAKTKENFPALGGVASSSSTFTNHPKQQAQISSVIKKNPNPSSTGMLIHVSNRASTSSGATNKKPSSKDFPALPSSSKATAQTSLREDLIPSNTPFGYDNVASKHRLLIDDYVSVANPNSFHKLQLVQKETEQAKAKKAALEASAPKLDSSAFPALASSSRQPAPSTLSTPSWGKSRIQQKEDKIPTSKVAPAPLLKLKSKKKNSKYNNAQNDITTSKNNNNSNNIKNNNVFCENNNKKENKSKNTESEGKKTSVPNGNGKTKKDQNIENKPANANSNVVKSSSTVIVPSSADIESNNGQAPIDRCVGPPPGFSVPLKPPPGFQNVALNSVAKQPNNLTFTSSFGESYNIIPFHNYIQPPEAISRNQKLVTYFKDILKTTESLEEFRQISQQFREGICNAQSYYEHCQFALKDKFDIIFPELLSLLPDINKQQELYLVHSQRLNSLSSDQVKSISKLEVCSKCKQVLLTSDANNHLKLHTMRDSFPTLEKTNNALTGV